MIPGAIVLMSSLSAVSFTLADAPATSIAAREYHVRTVDRRVRELIGIGASGSRTFSTLLDHLATSDVIVYVQIVGRIAGGFGGQLSFVTSAGPVRYLRVELASDGNPAEMVALLGHELQHAVEIADAPCVRDSHAMAMLYLQIGQGVPSGTQYESGAARITGQRVRDELHGSVHDKSGGIAAR